MAVKQLQERFNIRNVKMVEHKHFQFFCFHTNMLTFLSTEILCNWFFFYLGFLSWPFTDHRTAREHSCYGWKYITLFSKKASQKIWKHEQLSQNMWYFDKIKSFWKLMIWFYFCKKNCFLLWAWPIVTPFFVQAGPKNGNFWRFYLFLFFFFSELLNSN